MSSEEDSTKQPFEWNEETRNSRKVARRLRLQPDSYLSTADEKAEYVGTQQEGWGDVFDSLMVQMAVLINKRASSWQDGTLLNYEECKRMCGSALLDACLDFNPSRGSFATWGRLKIDQHLDRENVLRLSGNAQISEHDMKRYRRYAKHLEEYGDEEDARRFSELGRNALASIEAVLYRSDSLNKDFDPDADSELDAVWDVPDDDGAGSREDALMFDVVTSGGAIDFDEGFWALGELEEKDPFAAGLMRAYIYGTKPEKLAKMHECSVRTIYRKLGEIGAELRPIVERLKSDFE